MDLGQRVRSAIPGDNMTGTIDMAGTLSKRAVLHVTWDDNTTSWLKTPGSYYTVDPL